MDNRSSEITRLQRERVKFLSERASTLQDFFEAGNGDKESVVAGKIDLLNAQIEYAADRNDRQKVYDEIIQQYESWIKLIELLIERPDPRPIAETGMLRAKLLLLKSRLAKAKISQLNTC